MRRRFMSTVDASTSIARARRLARAGWSASRCCTQKRSRLTAVSVLPSPSCKSLAMRAFSSSPAMSRRRDKRVSSSVRSAVVRDGGAGPSICPVGVDCAFLKHAAATASTASPMESGTVNRFLNDMSRRGEVILSLWARQPTLSPDLSSTAHIKKESESGCKVSFCMVGEGLRQVSAIPLCTRAAILLACYRCPVGLLLL